MRHFGWFSNSVSRARRIVLPDRPKIGEKCQIQMWHFGWFSTTVSRARIIKRDQIIHTASILFYSMKRYYFLHLEKISSFFFNLIFLKYVVVLVLLSYPNCTLHTSTQRRKKGRKNKKKYLTMICKGVFFYEVLYPF